MKVLVGTFNQERALVGAFSVIVKTDCETDGSVRKTNLNLVQRARTVQSLGAVNQQDRGE